MSHVPEGRHRGDPKGPLTPKPAMLGLALLFTGLLAVNLWLDSHGADYDGKWLTFGLVGLIAGVLGIDVSQFWRGRGDE